MYIIQLVSEQCTYVHKDSLSLRIHYSDSENLKTFIGGILPDQVGVTYTLKKNVLKLHAFAC